MFSPDLLEQLYFAKAPTNGIVNMYAKIAPQFIAMLKLGPSFNMQK